MKVDILLGLQWGDEGKGKVVDVMAPHYDIIARFQGGPNAGHTLEFDGQKFVLNTIPSGIFRNGVSSVIGNGVLIDPFLMLRREIDRISAFTDVKSKLLISNRSHLILPTHRLLDAASETAKGERRIGSTLKGIAPAYTDKASRDGLRTGDLLSADFERKYRILKASHLQKLEVLFGYDVHTARIDGLSLEEYESEWLAAVEELRTYRICSTEYFLNNALYEGRLILAEGAQGSLLDVEFGTYPFVTSSNTIAAGVCSGLGIAPSKIETVYGLFKAYCTRVGEGVFPTELSDSTGELLQRQGNEFGSTTGRPRRCGWLDLPLLQYSCMLNGVNQLIMMKADVLNHLQTIRVCTSYQGVPEKEIPFELTKDIKVNYEELEGWAREITSADIPAELMRYITLIEDYLNLKITLVSIGPDREQNLYLS
ncbi:MAG: adenylosuccinate synthase [Lentimicrobiaceae bacterium]|nr:adenylosuccinate synthase [Lentimicrobiaceae bacterium]